MAKLSMYEKAARALLRAKDRWFKHGTTGAYARGKSGRPVDANSRRAVCWCASGALKRETFTEESFDIYRLAMEMLSKQITTPYSVIVCNDKGLLRRTHWNHAAAELRKQDKALTKANSAR